MENVVEDKSFRFAIRVVNMHKYLRQEKREYTMSKQLLRCGTSIGANIAEAQRAQSKADFISKINIALKEFEDDGYIFKWPAPDRFDFDGRFYNTFGVNSICKVAQTIFGLEGRYNFIYTPYDVGLNFYYSLPFTMEPYEAYEDTPVGEVMSYGYWTVQAVADYNYRRWFKTNPFAGVGVGGGKSITRTYTGMDYTEDPEYPVPVYSLKHTPIAILSLRCGIEYDGFLRFFVESHFSTDRNKGIYIGITWVI